jgi:hypothetical protein
MGLLVAGALAVTLGQPIADPGPLVEEAFVLRCLSSAEPAEVVRPLLRNSTNSVVHSASSPRILTVVASPEQMRPVLSVLDQYERAGSEACAAVPWAGWGGLAGPAPDGVEVPAGVDPALRELRHRRDGPARSCHAPPSHPSATSSPGTIRWNHQG